VSAIPRPYTLIAELSYRCPLRCTYCSNPIELHRYRQELDTDTWRRVLREAEALGVVQVSLTGGEPLLRDDLEQIVAEANALQLYSNLATSGVPLTEARLQRLRDAGLDNLQISFQDSEPAPAATIAGGEFHAQKLKVARWAKEMGLPLTVNVVLHRGNLDRIGELIALAEHLQADRLELANTQYLGWALANRQNLLPTREQLDHVRSVARDARDRLRGRMELLFVMPDYYGDYPKSCMDGWGRRFLLVAPDGRALPCHAAHTLPGIEFSNVRERSLEWIWGHSPGFNAFRGDAWMPEPCRSCERKALDHGGCRCQAYHLLGDAALTDPACRLSPHHELIERARREAQAGAGELRYRSMKREAST
jgi:PqqA peptide cyclase